MKKLLLVCAAIAVAALILAGCSKSKTEETSEAEEIPDPVRHRAVVLKTQGMVKAVISGKSVRLMERTELFEGDSISTGPSSFVDLEITGKGVARIKALTDFRINGLMNTNLQINISKGKVLTSLNKLAKNESFSVITPTIIAGVRGTSFMVSTEPGSSSIAVLTGKVKMNKGSSSVEVTEMKEIKAGVIFEKEKVIGGISLLDIKDMAAITAVETTRDADKIKINLAKLEIIDSKKIKNPAEINRILNAETIDIDRDSSEEAVIMKNGKVQIREKKTDTDENLMLKEK